jgi:single-strand DNA-binding protein
MSRSLNKVQLIGRLGGDPQMRYTQTGLAVTTFSLATNRQWQGKDGEMREETDWHTIVAWDRLAQICNEHLTKGRLVYIEGRLQTRSWEQDGQTRYKTEIVALDMLILDSRAGALPHDEDAEIEQPVAVAAASRETAARREAKPVPVAAQRRAPSRTEDETDPDDLPF